ncbi:hypothetical protein A5782_01545 [Mycobacterium sp. 852002-40037_SCH5390672]|nr:hypothetical protein A5782_01545 [Mycobacterium sp. 852002-40037_SCH5390672]
MVAVLISIPAGSRSTLPLEAIDDAGLNRADIDRVSSYLGAVGSAPAIAGAGTEDLRTMLGLNLRWHNAGNEMPGQLGTVASAVLAVAAGLASHVSCFRCVWESTTQKIAGDRQSLVSASTRDAMSWGKPYGAGCSTYGALAMQRYMHESGSSRDQFAQIAVVGRSNAAANPGVSGADDCRGLPRVEDDFRPTMHLRL